MRQGTKGFAGTGDTGTGQGGPAAGADGGARTGAGRVRAPARSGTRGREGDAVPGRDDAVRGEHTHSEPAAVLPRPRTPVQRSSVRGQVLAALRTALVTGDLRPGVVYSAPVLAERFGVSATPVREAMQQLALEGAVEVVPNRGFRVVERGDRELAELTEVRALIEVPMVLRLARTVPAERWAELRPSPKPRSARPPPAAGPRTPSPTVPSIARCSPSPATNNWSGSPRTSTAVPSGPWPAPPPALSAGWDWWPTPTSTRPCWTR